MRTAEFLRDNARWLGAGALLTFLSSFGQTFFISVFAGRILEEFALTDGEWARIYGAGTAISALIMIRAGSLTDQFRTGQLGIFVLSGLGLACLAMALNPWAGGLIGVVLLLRLFGQGMASHAAVVAMSRWFVATRGRALAVCTLGFTLGEMVFPVTCVMLLGLFDWRFLWLAAAAVAFLSIPLLLWLLREERHPSQMAEGRQVAGMGARHWQRRDVLGHPLFWFMIPALLGPAAFNTAFFFHQVHFAALKGWSHFDLVVYFPVYTGLGVCAMIVSGWAIDRWSAARLLPFYQLPMVVAFAAFSLTQSAGGMLFGLAFLAISAGSNSTIPNAFWAEFYGTRHIGAVKAMAAAVMVLGSAIGPALTGTFIDLGYSLTGQYLFVSAYFLMTTALMWVGVSRSRADLPDAGG